ncbi:MAG: GNAT family N-acetyltransferase [Gracilimonas sp.]|uniref:GNAT family N-acetyltransferase n=1 Tax=Gracilimonas sp. TaxID=1974203 RepID=UPI0019B87870|nr:GNAT family N-acetyltransferase [Gracilimonas sp.]MBD3615441.1 GNAT family N-acetyltransferase [Gracilimonas sp.]
MIDSKVISKEKADDEIHPSLKLEVISKTSDFDSLKEEWNTLAEQTGVHIFQAFEWQRTWWEVFGGNNKLHILLFRYRHELIGIMPFFLDSFRVFGSPVYRCLRLLGSRVIQPESGAIPVELAFSDYLSAIIHPDYKREVLTCLQEYLQSNSDFYDEIILEEIPQEDVLIDKFLPEMKQRGWKSKTKEASVCPQVHFPEEWDELLSDLSSNARYQIRRDIRRVTEDGIFELHTAESLEELKQVFQELVYFHQQRWHNLGQPGIFADKRITEFFEKVTMRLYKQGQVISKTLSAEGQNVAIDLYYKYNNRIYMIQRGFDDTSTFNQYGPGNVLLYCFLKEAIEEGIEVYDFLRGDEKYKLRTANHVQQNLEVILQKKTDLQERRSKVNNMVHNYARAKRKLYNEKQIMKVHMEKNNPVFALGIYMKEFFQRGIRKLNSSTKVPKP